MIQLRALAASQHFGSHSFERQELGSWSMVLERALDDDGLKKYGG